MIQASKMTDGQFLYKQKRWNMDKITQKKNEKYANLIAAAYELFEKEGIRWPKAHSTCILRTRLI